MVWDLALDVALPFYCVCFCFLCVADLMNSTTFAINNGCCDPNLHVFSHVDNLSIHHTSSLFALKDLKEG